MLGVWDQGREVECNDIEIWSRRNIAAYVLSWCERCVCHSFLGSCHFVDFFNFENFLSSKLVPLDNRSSWLDIHLQQCHVPSWIGEFWVMCPALWKLKYWTSSILLISSGAIFRWRMYFTLKNSSIYWKGSKVAITNFSCDFLWKALSFFATKLAINHKQF